MKGKGWTQFDSNGAIKVSSVGSQGPIGIPGQDGIDNDEGIINWPISSGGNEFYVSAIRTIGAVKINFCEWTPHPNFQIALLGTFTPDGSVGASSPLLIAPTLNPPANNSCYGTRYSVTANKASTGTHALFAGCAIGPMAVGAGAATLTDATALYISSKATGATNNYSELIEEGGIRWKAFGAGAATFDASGNISSVSDERFKRDIRPMLYGLKEIIQLKPIIYKYNELSKLETEHDYLGFGAEAVEKLIPEAVGRDKDGYRTLGDRGIIGALVNAIKELTTRISLLEDLVASK